MKERHIVYDISDLPLDTPAEINIARQRLEDTLAKTDEIQYANDQCNQWQEIADYMSLLIKGGGKLVYDEDNAIEIPKDETPAYFEWTLWRAALAIDHMVNKPYEVRGFRLDSDFLPVTAAGGGKGDLYCEFEDFMILTEVTMSTSSRQEAMEGEPVRRHVSDAVLSYNKPVYGLFLQSELIPTPLKHSATVSGMPKAMLSRDLILSPFLWSSSAGTLFLCLRESRLVLNI